MMNDQSPVSVSGSDVRILLLDFYYESMFNWNTESHQEFLTNQVLYI